MSATAQPATAHVRRPFRALRFTRDEELVRLLRSGDERAFEAIYDRHHRGILSFCRHMLGSAEEAEDAVQHTLIAAHRDLAGTDKPIQLKAWLYTIARNRCLSLLRARKEERALEDVPEPSVRGLTVEVQQRQDLRDLLADLRRLPEDQRAALVLSELGALSHEEIGATLGVRKDKIKALVFQARESLASSRDARDADCREIQEQLSVLRGGSLRRTTLRRHVEFCPVCSAFEAEVKRQRRAMAAILPVVPSLALKESILAAIFGGGAGGGGVVGGALLAAGGTKAMVAKVAAVAAVAGGATGGGLVAVDEISNGGDGTTATAMAAIPAEARSVRMVDALRERAKQTAGARAADRRAAGSSASAGRAVVTTDATAGEPRARERARRTSPTAVAGEDVVPTTAPAPAVTEAPASEAPASTGPGRTKGGKSRDERGKSKEERGEESARRRGRLAGSSTKAKKDADAGATAHAVGATAKRLRDRAVKRVTGRGPKRKPPVKAPPTQPVVPGATEARDGRDDRERGLGKLGSEDWEAGKKAYATVADVAAKLGATAVETLPRP